MKLPLYVRARIPEVWLVDLPNDYIEVYTNPAPEGYRDVRRLQRGQRLISPAWPDLNVLVDDILG